METKPEPSLGPNNYDRHREPLERVAEHLIRFLTGSGIGVREGQVMTPGPPPYRRLDCDARALCYVRVRPKKRGVRVDLSGLWHLAGEHRFRVPGSSGMASFMIYDLEHAEQLGHHLVDIVYYTRHRNALSEARRRSA